jgi:hypothetical protein
MDAMKLTYETGTATLIQFLVLGLLNLANGLNSVVTTCHKGDGCVNGVITSSIFYMLEVAWFGIIFALAWMAQERRSKMLARLLICAEGLVVLVALFSVRHHNDVLSLLTSIIDLLLALWVITLAFRLMRVGNARAVSRHGAGRNRPRQRKKPTS